MEALPERPKPQKKSKAAPPPACSKPRAPLNNSVEHPAACRGTRCVLRMPDWCWGNLWHRKSGAAGLSEVTRYRPSRTHIGG